MGELIHVNFIARRRRRPCRRVTLRGVRQVAPMKLSCERCLREIAVGSLHWSLSKPSGELYRRCDTCMHDGL